MEADKSSLWFDPEKLEKTHLRYSTVTGDLSLSTIIQKSRSDTDLINEVCLLISTKQVKISLHLRELIYLCMGSQINEQQISVIQRAYVDQCSKDPSTLLEIYCEMVEEFRLVRIDFAHSYSKLIREVVHRCAGIMEHPCFAEMNVTENLLIKKLSEIENHYNRVIEQEQQCRSHDVILV